MSNKGFTQVSGLSLGDSEYLLLAIEELAPQLQQEYQDDRQKIQAIEQQWNSAKDKYMRTRKQLEAVAVFLTIHHPDGSASWHKRLGLTEDSHASND